LILPDPPPPLVPFDEEPPEDRSDDGLADVEDEEPLGADSLEPPLATDPDDPAGLAATTTP
jgi:hypothetical protein